MDRDAKLSHLESVLGTLEYPCSRETAVEQCDDVTLLLADGSENLGTLLSRSAAETFSSPDELAMEVLNLLPRHAVGEPYQSEGEA